MNTPFPIAVVYRTADWRSARLREVARSDTSAELVVEACDAQGRLALPSDLVDGSGQKATGQRRTVS